MTDAARTAAQGSEAGQPERPVGRVRSSATMDHQPVAGSSVATRTVRSGTAHQGMRLRARASKSIIACSSLGPVPTTRGGAVTIVSFRRVQYRKPAAGVDPSSLEAGRQARVGPGRQNTVTGGQLCGTVMSGAAGTVAGMALFGSSRRPVFSVLDTETTGLSARRYRILEVGVCLLDARFREVGRWETLVDPQCRVTNSHLHGVSQAMVTGAPRFGEMYRELADVLDGTVLIAHNATFDAGFLDAEHNRVLTAVGARPFDFGPGFVDSIDLAKQILHQAPPYRADAVRALGLPYRPPRRR